MAKIQDSMVHDEFIDSYSFDHIEQKYLTLHGTVKGTPGYLAPEQCSAHGKKNCRTDIYSLGALLYELVTLKPLISGNIKILIDKTSRAELDIDSKSLSPGLEAIVRKALSFENHQRYQHVKEFSFDIQPYLQGFSPRAEQAGALREMGLFIRRHQRIFILSLVSIVCLIASTLVYIDNISRSNTKTQKALRELQNSQLRAAQAERQTASFQTAAEPQLLKDTRELFIALNWPGALSKFHKLSKVSPTIKNRDVLATLYLLNWQKKRSLFLLRSHNSKWSHMLTAILQDDYDNDDFFIEFTTEYSTKSLLLLSHFLLKDKFTDQSLKLLQRWPQVRDTPWLINLAAKLSPNTKQRILARVYILLKRSPWPMRVLMAEKARLLKPDEELQHKFEMIEANNLAFMRPTVSSVEDHSFTSNAVDGQLRNHWKATTTAAKLTVDLGAIYDIGKVLLYLSPNKKIKEQYQISTSLDKINYEIIVDRSHHQGPSRLQPETFHFAPIKARYIQVNMISNSLKTTARIREIKVYKFYKNLAFQAKIHSSKNLQHPERLVNGDSHRYAFATFTARGDVTLDLQKQVQSEKFRLYLENGRKLIHYFSIEVSRDRKDWTMVCDKSDNKISSPVGPQILTFAKQSFRYIRFKTLGNSRGVPFRLRELEVL